MAEEGLCIHTPRLRLVAAREVHLRAEWDHPERLGSLLGAGIPSSWPPGEYDRDAIAYFLARYESEGEAAAGWYGWYAIRTGDDQTPAELVGAAGYLGPPSADGTVEVGYSIVAEARGRGFATEIVRALVERASGLPGVKKVIAHANEDNAPSQAVLARAGFQRGPVDETGRRRFEHSVRTTA